MYLSIYKKIKSNEINFNNLNSNLNLYWEFFITPLNLILAPLLVIFKVSANICSYLVLFSSLFASYIIFFLPEKVLIAFFFFILSDILDCADGTLARFNNATSKFGRILDTSIDHFLINFHVLVITLSIIHNNKLNIFLYHESYLFFITGMIIILHWLKKYLNILIKYEKEPIEKKNKYKQKNIDKKIFLPYYNPIFIRINNVFNYLDGFYFKGFGLIILIINFEFYIIVFFIIKIISNILNTIISFYSIRTK